MTMFFFPMSGLPALLVSILLLIENIYEVHIYGERKIVPSDDVNNPYRM